MKKRFISIDTSYHVVPISSHEIFFYSKGNNKALRVESKSTDLIKFLRTAISGCYFEELYPFVSDYKDDREAEAAIMTILKPLIESGIASEHLVENKLTDIEYERYSRQLNFFGHWENLLSTDRFQIQTKISKARILVLGLGSLGSWCLQSIVAAGIGEVIGVDDDVVEISNLARQSFYLEEDIGRLKAQATKERLAGLNKNILFHPVEKRISSIEDVLDLIEKFAPVNLVLLTADQPPHEITRWVTSACKKKSVPLLKGCSLGIGPLYLPWQDYACPACQWGDLDKTIPNYKTILENRTRLSAISAVISPEVAIHGSIMASEAIKFLAGYESLESVGSRIKYDLMTNRTRIERMPKSNNCKCCNVF